VVLTKHDLLAMLDKLSTVYHQPKDTDVTVLADIWHRVLGGYPVEVVQAGIDAYLASDARYWPKPGEIRKLVVAAARELQQVDASLRGRYDRWLQSTAVGDRMPCPVCGATLSILPTGRYGVQHDARPHDAAGVPYHGPRAAQGAPRAPDPAPTPTIPPSEPEPVQGILERLEPIATPAEHQPDTTPPADAGDAWEGP